MSGIAGIVHWDGRPVADGDLGRMLGAIRHRGPDGLVGEVTESVALGQARLAMRAEEREHTQPVWLPDRSCAIVADARLYNREELLSDMAGANRIAGPASDAALLLAGYERWGVEVLQRLNGDFAFAIWDSSKQQIFAARDPFGAKPFVFWSGSDTFRFGSEPKQLLIFPEVPVEPESQTVVEHLLDLPKARELTFFRGVHRLRAAHFLVASADGIAQRTYWHPESLGLLELSSEEEAFDRFRALFKQSIASRLGTDGSVGAQLSGGLDSSSVAAMAAEIYGDAGEDLPQLETISETYASFPCDETPYIETMAEWLPFPSRRIDCSEFDFASSIETEVWNEDGPTAELTPDRTRSNSEVLSSFDARILMTGYGGDELTWDPEWAPDLLKQGRVLSALEQSWQLSRLPEEDALPSILKRAIVQSIPESLRASLAAIRPRRTLEWPVHLQPDLLRPIGDVEEPLESRNTSFSSAQRTVLRWLTDPLLYWNLERLEQRYAFWGVEMRHPFFDRGLAELVLTTPFERRVAPPSRRKALLQEAMQGILPPEILRRRSQVVFDSYFQEAWRQWQPRLRAVIHSSDAWLSEPYTDRETVLSWLESPARDETMPMRVLSQVWAALGLEVWLRGLGRYSAAEYDDASQSLGDEDHA